MVVGSFSPPVRGPCLGILFEILKHGLEMRTSAARRVVRTTWSVF